jgi:hypothetical protein
MQGVQEIGPNDQAREREHERQIGDCEFHRNDRRHVRVVTILPIFLSVDQHDSPTESDKPVCQHPCSDATAIGIADAGRPNKSASRSRGN